MKQSFLVEDRKQRTNTLVQSKTIAVFFLPTAFAATEDGQRTAAAAAACANIGYSLRSSISQTKPINCPSPLDRGGVSSGASLLSWELEPLSLSLSPLGLAGWTEDADRGEVEVFV